MNDTMPVKPKGILVVEDNHDLRTVICTALRYQGFQAYEAGSAEEALAILDTQKDIQLVFFGNPAVRKNVRHRTRK